MLYREIIDVYTSCGQNAKFVNVKPVGAYRDHWALKRYDIEEPHKLKLFLWALTKVRGKGEM
jgi:hypothetical protein